MEKNWEIKEIRENSGDEKFAGFHPLLQKILRIRGIQSCQEMEKYLKPDYTEDIHDPFVFSDMEKAVTRIIAAGEKKEKIAIFGDYDVDGITASVMLAEALEQLGFGNSEIYIPDRQLEGYGLNKEAVEYLAKIGIKLIITVDCGITGVAEVSLAKNLGMDVVITDHHHAPDALPEALAIINPNVAGCAYPFKNLAGVGVVFKLVQALYQKTNPKNIEKIKWFLDLVAVGTIADCVPLLGENRVLAKYGLVVLSKTRRLGFREIFKVGRIAIDENNPPDAQKVSFQIAPRINAAGRMDHANSAYKLMVEKNPVLARDLALELELKNQERQKITAEIVREIRIIAENSFRNRNLIFAANEHWPVGILGLIAGKIAEEFAKPAVILQKQKQEYAGSLRSVPPVNIISALEKCSNLLIKFGGHSQAAGVRVAPEKIEKFYEKLSRIIDEELAGKEIIPRTEIDLEISCADINWDLVGDIRRMEPFGEGNEEPVFLVRDLQIQEARVVGNGSRHLKLALSGSDNAPKIFDAIGFGMGEKISGLKSGAKADIVCNLREDEWNGSKKIQLKLIDFKIV